MVNGISPYLQTPDQSIRYIALAYRQAIYLVIGNSYFISINPNPIGNSLIFLIGLKESNGTRLL